MSKTPLTDAMQLRYNGDIPGVAQKLCRKLESDRERLIGALRDVMGQQTNIEVLGEWSALDINLKLQKTTRARVDAITEKARSLLSELAERDKEGGWV